MRVEDIVIIQFKSETENISPVCVVCSVQIWIKVNVDFSFFRPSFLPSFLFLSFFLCFFLCFFVLLSFFLSIYLCFFLLLCFFPSFFSF